MSVLRSVLARTSAVVLPVALALAAASGLAPDRTATPTPPAGLTRATLAPQPRPTDPRVHKHRMHVPDSDAARLSGPDATRAGAEAQGRRVRVASASVQVAVPSLAVLGVTWRQGSAPGTSVQYRTRTSEGWGPWQFVNADTAHRPDAAEAAAAARRTGGVQASSAPIITTNAQDAQVRLVAPTGTTPSDPQLVVVDPGSPSSGAAPAMAPVAFSAADPAMPQVFSRAQWGADESLRDQSPPEYGVVEAAFVHHTDGSNDYTADEVPGIIRGIYAYHVKGNGWRDIGYNFLVDRFGRIWEGRWGGMDKAVVGAHTYGLNASTFGVSVLGNYETAQPASASITALAKLIGWKASVHHFDVLGRVTIAGKTYNTVSGHRDGKDNSTDCPGQYLYAKLATIRQQAAGYVTPVDRFAGSDRYATAAAVSAQMFGAGAPVAYVATGADFPDALAGAAAAASLGGPVLLTQRGSLPAATTRELSRLKPHRIVILGGTGVVSSAVASRLRTYAGTIQRQDGADRFGTAAAVSRATFGSGAPVAYVATGTDYPDALAAGPAGGAGKGPVLLVNDRTIPGATATELQRLKPRQIIVLGGPDVVSASVEQTLRSYSPSVSRVSGADRYATSAALSAATFNPGGPVAFVATGTDFPDALAGGAAGGARGGPILLTRSSTVPAPTLTELARLRPARIVVLGGSGVVDDSVARQLTAYEAPPSS